MEVRDVALAAAMTCARQFRIIDAGDIRNEARMKVSIGDMNAVTRELVDRGVLHRGRGWRFYSQVYEGC
jgi:hypothetical protein